MPTSSLDSLGEVDNFTTLMTGDATVLPKRVWMVGSFLDVRCNTPIEIIPGHSFRKASDAEIERIQTFLTQFPSVPYRICYEEEFVPVDPLKPEGTVESKPLERKRWRYYVIEPPQAGVPMDGGGNLIDGCYHDLVRASRLCRVELRCGVTIYPQGEGWHQSNPLPRIDRFPTKIDVFDGADVAEITNTYEAVTTIAPKFQDIARAIDMFFGLREIDASQLYVLGLFAVIEKLLTHDPHGDYDSLGHQIRSKIPLLTRRMKEKPDYGNFGAADVSKVWNKLYAYRSSIAHGGNADFSQSLKILRSPDLAKTFLEGTVKSLIRHALAEPELVLDLRVV
jgi:Apea-like HEPN